MTYLTKKATLILHTLDAHIKLTKHISGEEDYIQIIIIAYTIVFADYDKIRNKSCVNSLAATSRFDGKKLTQPEFCILLLSAKTHYESYTTTSKQQQQQKAKQTKNTTENKTKQNKQTTTSTSSSTKTTTTTIKS